MDIEYIAKKGITITSGQKAKIVLDASDGPVKAEQGATTIKLATTAGRGVFSDSDDLVVSQAGEYEIKGVSIRGILILPTDAGRGNDRSLVFTLEANGVRLAVITNAALHLTDEQVENIGPVDVLVLYLDGSEDALPDIDKLSKLVKTLEPSAVLPMGRGEVESSRPKVASAVAKELSAQVEVVAKLKLKPDSIPKSLVVYQLS